MSVYHPQQSSDGEPQDWCTLIIGNTLDSGESTPQDQRYNLEPAYILSGQIVDNGQSFIVHEMTCRKPPAPDTEKVDWAIAEDEIDLKAMLIYGHTAMTAILNNQTIDAYALQPTLDVTRYDVEEEFNFIRRMSSPVIEHMALRESFQIDNEDLFDMTPLDMDDEDTELYHQIFSKMQMQAAGHLADGGDAQNIFCYLVTTDQNAVISFLDYSVEMDGEKEQYLVGLFSEQVQFDENKTILVYCAFEGQIIEGTFIPRGIRYRKDTSSPCLSVDMNNHKEVKAAFEYIDGVFVSILAEQDIDVAQLAQKLAPENHSHAEKYFDYMFQRTDTDLQEAIAGLETDDDEGEDDEYEEKKEKPAPLHHERLNNRLFLAPHGGPWIERNLN